MLSGWGRQGWARNLPILAAAAATSFLAAPCVSHTVAAVSAANRGTAAGGNVAVVVLQ